MTGKAAILLSGSRPSVVSGGAVREYPHAVWVWSVVARGRHVDAPARCGKSIFMPSLSALKWLGQW